MREAVLAISGVFVWIKMGYGAEQRKQVQRESTVGNFVEIFVVRVFVW